MRSVGKVAALLAALAAVLALPAHARAGQCDLPDTTPLWIDFSPGPNSPVDPVLRKPGLILAASGIGFPEQLRASGAKTGYWDM